MIIDFSTTYKNYRDEILNFKGIWNYKCPICDTSRSFQRHGTYPRFLIVLSEEGLCEQEIDIQRLYCTSCKHTHAILPADVVPFCIYSMSAIVHLLGSHLLEEKPVLTLAEETGIPYQVIYSFLSLLSTYLSKITLLLRFLSLWEASSSPTLKQTLARITAYTPARFMVDYFNHDQLPLFLKRKDTSSYPLRFSGSG